MMALVLLADGVQKIGSMTCASARIIDPIFSRLIGPDVAASEDTEHVPVGLSEDDHQQVADDGERQADLDAVLGRERLSREGEDALRRVDRQDKAEAHDELQDHGDADDVQRIVAESLQDGNHDRDHGRGYGRRARKAKVYDNEEQGEDGKDYEDAQAGQSEDIRELIGEPGGGLRREQDRAHADADAEEDQRTPGNV